MIIIGKNILNYIILDSFIVVIVPLLKIFVALEISICDF